jgi:hypothetical protein
VIAELIASSRRWIAEQWLAMLVIAILVLVCAAAASGVAIG